MRKPSGFPFPSGFRDFEKKNQTEQTVNRKKSGFRAALFSPSFLSQNWCQMFVRLFVVLPAHLKQIRNGSKYQKLVKF